MNAGESLREMFTAFASNLLKLHSLGDGNIIEWKINYIENVEVDLEEIMFTEKHKWMLWTAINIKPITASLMLQM